MIQIFKWQNLPETSWNSLILGNGASIALHSGFGYTSLHAVANAAGTLPTTAPIFTSLGTTDFEHVLLACWHANLVNTALGAPAPMIASAYTEVRDALIAAVQQTHCLPTLISNDLQKIGVFASQFSTVVTFNYDLTLYWSTIAYNYSQHGNWFKDGFIIKGQFDPHWQRLRPPYGAKSTTMVFYAHGSLMIARDIHSVETKLAASSSASGSQTLLLNTITNAWITGTHVPVFVSEGTSSEKLQSIWRSPYLTTVYNHVLSDIGDAVVVYGLSFAQNDQHIIEAIKQNPPNRIAVSVFGGQPPAQQQAFCHHVSAIFAKHLPNTSLMFFDSQSPCCWNN